MEQFRYQKESDLFIRYTDEAPKMFGHFLNIMPNFLAT